MSLCRHCHRASVNRPRGLCWSCYYTPGVRERYPSTSKFARRGVGNFCGNAQPCEPTAALPGTPTQDPAFGLPAIWIDTNLREQAQVYGYASTTRGGIDGD